MAVLFMFHAWFFAQSIRQALIADLLGFYLLVISCIDYRHRIIPDELSLSLLGAGLLFSFVNPYLSGPPSLKFLNSLASSLVGGTLMFLLAYAGEKAFRKEALGGGDVKLIAATAALLGWRGIAGPLFLGSVSGGSVALILLLAKKKKLGETLPFGPFLSLGAYAACLYPDFWTVLFHP
jgi:leader peptidase (prepilin peptidase)/N-methyltransferase